MPRSGTHPRALFSLIPMNDRAREVVSHPMNAHLVSVHVPTEDDPEPLRLDIGPHIGSRSRYTLATIGRCGDICVDGGSGISRIQCSFEIDPSTQEIMIQDRSSTRSTQLHGESAMPFEQGRPHRRVIIDDETNLEFGFGGEGRKLYHFEIFWQFANEGKLDGLEDREDIPRHTRTDLDEPSTAAQTGPVTRIHTPGVADPWIRYSMRVILGRGAFGEAWKVANVDTGEHLAVKRVVRPHKESYNYHALKREVELLSRVSHVSRQHENPGRKVELPSRVPLQVSNTRNLPRWQSWLTAPAEHHRIQDSAVDGRR